MGYYLTENYGVPHGFACATFLPAMLACVRGYDAAYADAFYSEIGADEGALTGLIRDCLPEMDIRMTSEEVATALPRWEDNGSVKNTRADVTTKDIRALLESLFV